MTPTGLQTSEDATAPAAPRWSRREIALAGFGLYVLFGLWLSMTAAQEAAVSPAVWFAHNGQRRPIDHVVAIGLAVRHARQVQLMAFWLAPGLLLGAIVRVWRRRRRLV